MSLYQSRLMIFCNAVVLVCLMSCSSFRPTDHDIADEQYTFAAEVLRSYFIFRDMLPNDLYAFETPLDLFEAVGEPYTNYYNKEQAKWLFQQLTTTVTGGVGIRIDSAASGYVIKDVFFGSPGETAGLLAGDTIIRVDDSSAIGMMWETFVFLLQGEIGSNVLLRIKRNNQYHNIPVTRGTFLSPSVFVDSLNETTVSITLIGFYEETGTSGGSSEELSMALEATEWAEHTIIDLRANGGGRVDQCIDIISLLVEEGTPIINYHERVVEEETNKSVELSKHYVAIGPGTWADREIIMLVSRATASASEIMTSCLMQRDGVMVIGDTTYGKARGQYIFEGPGDVAATVTAMTFTPANDSTKTYDLVGIPPDIVADTGDALDYALAEIEETTAAKRRIVTGIRPSKLELQLRKNLPLAVVYTQQ